MIFTLKSITHKLKLIILKTVKICFLVIFVLLIAELILQAKMRFFDGTIMRDDDDYEYIAVANQTLSRYGRKISYNSLSMRSEEPDTTKNIILAFGDSIINGGEFVDQDSLTTTRLNNFFKDKYQFLNISAGSWGPDNCYAYLKKHGDFGTEHIILFVSSHDAYDNMRFDRSTRFGHPNDFVLYKLFNRYILTKYREPKVYPYNSGFNSGFTDFHNYCKAKKIPLLIYLHPELVEIEQQAYHNRGQEIIQFCREKDINLIQGLTYNFSAQDYRDNIHLNEWGQRKLAFIMEKSLLNIL